MFTDPDSARITHTAHLIEARQARTAPQPITADRRHGSAVQRLRSIVSSLRRSGGSSVGFLNDSHELFTGHDKQQLSRLGQLFTVIDVPAGRTMGQQGRIAREFVTILEGEVGVTIDGIPHAVLDDGSHFGALPLLDRTPGARHSASFTVMSPTRLAVATAAEFHTLMADFPLVAARVQAMTDVRRAYLAGLAQVDIAGGQRATDRLVEQYPVHVQQPQHV